MGGYASSPVPGGTCGASVRGTRMRFRRSRPMIPNIPLRGLGLRLRNRGRCRHYNRRRRKVRRWRNLYNGFYDNNDGSRLSYLCCFRSSRSFRFVVGNGKLSVTPSEKRCNKQNETSSDRFHSCTSFPTTRHGQQPCLGESAEISRICPSLLASLSCESNRISLQDTAECAW